MQQQIVLIFLLATNFGNLNATENLDERRGRLPKPQRGFNSRERVRTKSKEITSATNLNLPTGFNPVPSPLKPLLYPFVMDKTLQQPIESSTSESPWRPMILRTHATTERSYTHVLQLEDRNDNFDSNESNEREAIPVHDTVVYGVWKPEPPLEPKEIYTMQGAKTQTEPDVLTRRQDFITDISEEGKSYETKQKPYYSDSISKRNSLHYVSESSNSSTRIQSNNTNSDKAERVKKQQQRKRGRQKIKAMNSGTILTPPSSDNKTISLNGSDMLLLEIAKDISASQESRKINQMTMLEKAAVPTLPSILLTSTSKARSTTESAMSSTNEARPAVSSKIWPTDFLKSKEQSTLSYEKLNYSTEKMPLQLEDINETFSRTEFARVPKIPLKTGRSYEDKNSTEESTVCVPITIREQSVTNKAEIVQLERVYCFPLPPTEVKEISENLTPNGEFNMNDYDYGDGVTATAGISQATLKFVSISVLSCMLLRL